MIGRRSVLAGLPAVGVALAVPAVAIADPRRAEFVDIVNSLPPEEIAKLHAGVRAMAMTTRPAADRIAYHQRELRRALREERGGTWIVCGINRSGPGSEWFGVPPGWGLKADGKPAEEQS
jgi:hypothetical protein